MNILANLLGSIINFVYSICNNYGVTIIIFTFIAKIILFPLNILIQKNSIKMVKIKPKINELKLRYKDDKEQFMEEQIKLFNKEKYKPSLGVIPLLIQIPIILGLITVIKNPDLYINNLSNKMFLGLDLSVVPTFEQYLIIPIISIVSCVLLCFFENKSNVLQRYEKKSYKIITTVITTVITAYFVSLVPVGVILYWTIGNLLAIIQIYILNYIIPLDKETEKRLQEEKRKNVQERLYKLKEKDDYKTFFEEEKNGKVELVFYSEQSGFYKYFSGIIEYILNNSDINIYYITSDPNDDVFKLNNERIKPYYFGTNKLISAFMKLEAKIVVMTTPDLQKYYLKKSLVQKDIEYIFLDHGITSSNLTLRTGALDHYSTIFSTGPEQTKEMRELEQLRGTEIKNIVEVGYPYLDELARIYNKNHKENNIKTILIAPSHQEDNVLDSCIDEIVENLVKDEYKIIIRPHPQYIRRYKDRMDTLLEKYKEKFNDKFYFELDFKSNETVYQADLVITDWSGIGIEYSLSTTKPTLYINTKMKVVNKDYEKIETKPMDIVVRNMVGKAIEKDEINNISNVVEELISNREKYKDNIKETINKYVYNYGCSTKVGAEYIINKIKNLR